MLPTTFGLGSHSNFDSHTTNLDFKTQRFKQDEQLKDLKSKIREQLEAVKNVQREDLSDDSASETLKSDTKKSAQNNSMFKAFMGGNDQQQKTYFVKEIEQSTPNEIKQKLQDQE